MQIKVDLPPPVHFSMCTEGFPYKTYGVRKRNLGIASINRQIQKYVANHNKDGPKTNKCKNEEISHSTFFSTLLYFYFPPYVLYGKRVVHFEKDSRGWQIYFDSQSRKFTMTEMAISTPTYYTLKYLGGITYVPVLRCTNYIQVVYFFWWFRTILST